MSKIKKAGLAISGFVGSLVPVLAGAQVNYESQLATTTALAQEIGADVLGTIVVVIGIVVGIVVFIMGVGYTIRKLKSKTGMKAF